MAETFPEAGMELTQILVVADAERSRDFYRHVLGAGISREHGATPVVMRFLGSWVLLVTGGPRSADKTHGHIRAAGRSRHGQPRVDDLRRRLSRIVRAPPCARRRVPH